MKKTILTLLLMITAASALAQTAALTIGTDTLYADEQALVDVAVSEIEGKDVTAWEMTIAYDTTALSFAGVFDDGLIGQGAVSNASVRGTVKVAWASAYAIDSSGVLIQLLFDITTTTTDIWAPISFIHASLNEGSPLAVLANGGVFIEEDDTTLFVNASPIEWSLDNRSAVLSWVTYSEFENAGFHIQQLTSDSTWMQVGFVEGAGTTDEPQLYRWESEYLYAGTHTFRYLQVDYTGRAIPSVAVIVDVPALKMVAAHIYPNPARERVTLNASMASSGIATIELFDVIGKHYGTKEVAVKTGYQEIPIELHGLSAGIYFLRITSEGAMFTRRLVILG